MVVVMVMVVVVTVRVIVPFRTFFERSYAVDQFAARNYAARSTSSVSSARRKWS